MTPPTADPRMFLLSIALLPLYFFVTEKTINRLQRHKGVQDPKHIRAARWFIAVGVVYVVLMLSQLRFLRWNDDALGSLFGWACGHGMPAIIMGRMTWAIVRSLKPGAEKIKVATETP